MSNGCTNQNRTIPNRQKVEIILDGLHSEYIRRRAIQCTKGCQCCHKPKLSYKGLEAAHLHSRGRRTVRWDIRNSAGVDHDCHRYLDTHPSEKKEFFKKLLGEDEYWKLFQLANMTTKAVPVDYEKVEAQFRELLKEV